jgi:hypothetical protein
MKPIQATMYDGKAANNSAALFSLNAAPALDGFNPEQVSAADVFPIAVCSF